MYGIATWNVSSAPAHRPAVVAIGGGHGLAMTLRALREYAGEITAIVSVADDGGSTGRLRRDFGVLGVGDLRKCLVALARDRADGGRDEWTTAFEHRFAAGDLEGHALGNLLLVGLAEATGDFERAVALAGEALGTVGRVLPATSEPVVLKAHVDGGEVLGQVAVQNSTARIRRVALVPDDARSPESVVTAIAAADQVVLAPGSLFTSLLPNLCVNAVHETLVTTGAAITQVANLHSAEPESRGLDAADQLEAVLEMGIPVAHFLVATTIQLAVDEAAIADLGVHLVRADIARPDVMAHAPAKLAPVLATLLES